jgi:hypothetical protein
MRKLGNTAQDRGICMMPMTSYNRAHYETSGAVPPLLRYLRYYDRFHNLSCYGVR